MISIRQKNLIGYILISIGLVTFIPFGEMAIRASLANPDALQNIFITLHVFFFTTWIIIHIPGFILIGIGIYLLLKNSRNKSNNLT